jgi:hypothetical protein
MTANELISLCRAAGPDYQRYINAFVDDFRRADASTKVAMLADGPDQDGELEGLVAAVASALCREVDIDPPSWVPRTRSPRPFFAFPARGFALRLRLMLESPPPFLTRNVFVPADYLSRA